MGDKLIYFLITIFLSSFLAIGNSQSDGSSNSEKEVLQEATLWPGTKKKGINLKFSEAPEDFYDLWELMVREGFYTLGKLCVTGAFVLYEEPLFQIKSPDDFEISVGDNRCTSISASTKSIQPIGSMGQVGGASITFFEKQYFGSPAFPTMTNVGSDFFRKMDGTRSAILIGQTPWTLELDNGTKICLQPDFDPTEPKPVCEVIDINEVMGLSPGDEELAIERATQGCDEDTPEELLVKLQECIYWKTGLRAPAENLFEDDSALIGRSSGDICSDDEKSKELFTLYKSAIMKDFDTPFLVDWPKLGKNAWKLDLLDWTFTIVANIIGEDIITSNFLTKTRELFAMKLVKVWNDENEKNFDLSENEYQNLIRLTKKCSAAVQLGTKTWRQQFSTAWEGIQSPSDFVELIDPAFVRDTNLNFAAETAWVVGHMTGYLCHGVFMFKNHYWATFFNAFWNFYMLPVVPEWKQKDIGLQLYYGGINYNVEYQKVAMFASFVKHAVNDLEPLQKPSGLVSTEENKEEDKEENSD